MENNKIDIGAELERIKADILDIEESGKNQSILGFFKGSKNEREFIAAAGAFVKSRGYAAEFEYEDDELVLIIRKAA